MCILSHISSAVDKEIYPDSSRCDVVRCHVVEFLRGNDKLKLAIKDRLCEQSIDDYIIEMSNKTTWAEEIYYSQRVSAMMTNCYYYVMMELQHCTSDNLQPIARLHLATSVVVLDKVHHATSVWYRTLHRTTKLPLPANLHQQGNVGLLVCPFVC